jgi:predicted nucleic acid-binding Zn finger protein
MSQPKILSTEVVDRGRKPYAVFTVPSSSESGEYRVDMTNGRCSCPGWKFQRAVDGKRRPCKHLRAFGYTEVTQIVTKASKPAGSADYAVML